MKKLLFISTLTFAVLLLTFNFSYAETTSICKNLNSLNVYSFNNLSAIQRNLQNYFPKLVTTGLNDKQNKYYIGQFQFAFGLKPTYYLDSNTLMLLRNQNKCFDFDKKVGEIQTAKYYFVKSTDDLIFQILNENVYPQN